MPMTCLITKLTYPKNGVMEGAVAEYGHMLWLSPDEAVKYAKQMGYGIELSMCEIFDPPCPVRDGINQGKYDHMPPLYSEE